MTGIKEHILKRNSTSYTILLNNVTVTRFKIICNKIIKGIKQNVTGITEHIYMRNSMSYTILLNNVTVVILQVFATVLSQELKRI